MNEFEDIEQLLKPQCEFKASETLKQEVMEKAHEEIRPRRTIKLWPWLAAACVIGFIVMYLMPPKSAVEDSMEGKPLRKLKRRNPQRKQNKWKSPKSQLKVLTLLSDQRLKDLDRKSRKLLLKISSK